jgi:phenylalanyl-tRNA synthetase beta chain
VSATAALELALANPFVADQSHLRPTLIMGLLDTLRLNQSRGVAVTRLAETGRVFVERDGQNYECLAAGFIVAEDPGRHWLRREPMDFYAAKHHVQALARAAGIDLSGAPLVPVTGPFDGWQEGHSAAAGTLRDGWVARFGLLNLAMVRDLGLTGQVYAGIFALLPEKLPAGAARRRHREFSLFPAALRDLALVVDAATPSGDVRRALSRIARAAAGSLALEEVEVFDVYRGEGLPPGKKSLAFSLVFRSADRTLADDEINALFRKIQQDLVAATPYQIRH